MREKNKTVILVAGMHRSGTSAITRLLGLFGCDLPKLLVPANWSNISGYWEPLRVVNLNEEILASMHSSWDDWANLDSCWHDYQLENKFMERALIALDEDFGDSSLFALKDPRICRLLPFWIEVLSTFGATPLIVSPIRNPLDVAASLYIRDGIEPWIAHNLWLRHFLDVDEKTRDFRRAWLSYDEVLSRPYEVMNRLENALGVTWPKHMSANIQTEVEDFLSLELRHHHTDCTELETDPTLSPLLVSSFEIFNRWSYGDMNSGDLDKLRRIKSNFDAIKPDIKIAELNARIGTLGDALAKRDGEIAELNARIGTLGDALAKRDGEIAELNARIGTLGDALAKRDGEIAELNARIGTLGDALAKRDGEIESIYISKSWRVTAPLRGLRRLSVALGWGVRRTIARTVRVVWRQIPLSSATKIRVRNLIFERTPLPFLKHSGRYNAWKVEKQITGLYERKKYPISWGIMATPHTLFIAKAIERRLQAHGWNVHTTTSPPDDFSLAYYIVICPQFFEKLPPFDKLISFQVEQTVSSRWFDEKYLYILNNSFSVLEYATHNFPFLNEMKIAFPHVHYLPICGLPSYEGAKNEARKTCEILFYGDNLSSPRRQRLLSELKKKYNVLIVNDVFGSPLEEIIQSARVVINLHHYENGLLEVPRIWQCLSLGTPVVSESSSDQKDYPELEGVVTFFGQGSVASMLYAVEDALKNPPSKQKMSLSVKASNERFSFMFDRFLIAIGILPSSYIREICPPVLSGDKILISMPETFMRRNDMIGEFLFNEWTVFDGIRRQPSWIGCGMSHYVIARYAQISGMKRIQVAEDDVVFGKDFPTKIKSVHKFLDQKEGSWDLFCGLISDLNSNTKILSVEVFDGTTFVTIDKMTSTVFCIYNERLFQRIVSWDFDNLNSENTIDRFIENLPNLKVVVTLPFLVRQNEKYDSVLWGFNNAVYSEMIKESENRLYKMVALFNGSVDNA